MPSGATKSYFYVNIYFLNFAKIVMNTLVQAKKSSNLQKLENKKKIMTARKESKMNPAEKKSQQDTADWNKNKHKNINDSNGIRNGNLQVTTDTLNTLNIKFKGSYTPRCTLKKG